MRRANVTFYARHAAEDTFRTSMAAAPLMARALLNLIAHVDEALDHPDALDVVDVGCGNGAVLASLLRLTEQESPDRTAGRTSPRLKLHGIDLRARPPGLDERITWTQGPAPDALPRGVTGLVMAHEWLDDLPVDVVNPTPAEGAVRLMVDVNDQSEHWAPLAQDAAAAQWARTWGHSKGLVESGHLRDAAWAEVASSIDAGLLLAIDYGHLCGSRPAEATLRGFTGGQVVAPVVDGSMNITAHVALDACAAQARTALDSNSRAGSDAIITQAEALDLLLPPQTAVGASPSGGLHALAEHGQRSELVDPQGLGAHLWLLQSVDIPLPFGGN